MRLSGGQTDPQLAHRSRAHHARRNAESARCACGQRNEESGRARRSDQYSLSPLHLGARRGAVLPPQPEKVAEQSLLKPAENRSHVVVVDRRAEDDGVGSLYRAEYLLQAIGLRACASRLAGILRASAAIGAEFQRVVAQADELRIGAFCARAFEDCLNCRFRHAAFAIASYDCHDTLVHRLPPMIHARRITVP